MRCSAGALSAVVAAFAACSQPKNVGGETTLTGATSATMTTRESEELARCEAEKRLVGGHIATFDDLDFNVFSHQKWNELSKSHSQDVLVHWPDGHSTKGLEKHVDDLKAMFAFAPDTHISEHIVRLGSDDWTSVIGMMEGTFTKPMPMGGGKAVPATNSPFRLSMVTIGHWKNGVMDEEYLFWDNAAFMKQIGLPP